jgi:hypothetical protein
MAENLENFSFSIEDTMDMGAGNPELIKDLMAPETASGDPEELKPIVKEVEKVKESEKKTPKIKEIPGDDEEKQEQNLLSDFLGGGEDEDEEEVEKVVPISEEEEVVEEESQFSTLSRDLLKLGVFTTEEDEEESPVKTAEEFLERFNVEKKKGAIEIVNNFIGQFGEDYQRAFDAIFVKGVSPKDYFAAYNNIVNFAELDITKEENQVAVIQRALADQGYEQDEITAEIDRLKNYGDVEPVATRHHKMLVKKEAAKLQELEKQSQAELQRKATYKDQYIQNVQTVLAEKLKTKEYDGIPINPKLAGELQEFLLVDKYQTPTGETLTDFDRVILELKRPENHAMKVKVALLLKILEKDPTLSTIQRVGVTKQTNQLFAETVRQKTTSKGVSTPQKTNSWFKDL